MNISKNKKLTFFSEKAYIFITTFFYVGYVPFMPGTFGTIAAIPFYLLLSLQNKLHYFIVWILIFIFSIHACTKASQYFNSKDPKQIVLDEVVGYLLVMLFANRDLKSVLLGFLFFRIFDIAKPYPIYTIQKLKSGFGIVLDDVLAAVYSILLLFLVRFL